MAQGANLQKLFERVHDDIYSNLYHEAIPSRRFITVEAQQSIWKREGRMVIVAQHLKLDHDTLRIVEDSLLTTMSILVYIRWGQWERFKHIFDLHPDHASKQVRNDSRVMDYTFEELCAKNFFDKRSTARDFVDNRAVFLPLHIDEGSVVEADETRRLPFINSDQGETNVIGEGFYGKVTKEVVAALHFRDKSGLSANLKPKAVACKRFHDIMDFEQERQNLKFLHSSARQHRQIVTFSAIISIGRTLCVLSPLATMDLHNFLLDGGENFKDNFKESAFKLTLSSMVKEARHLLDALQFLHDGLYVSNDGRIPCCHMDFKPSNILVYPDDTSRKSDVGIWKISDFGISSVPQSKASSHAASQSGNSHLQVIQTLSDIITRTTRTPKVKPEVRFGTWLAPELHRSIGDVDGRKNDMWSFGCVLVQILARTIRGIEGLLVLDQQRKSAILSDQPANDTFYRGEPGAYIINPAIQTWLDHLPGQLQGQYSRLLVNCKNLILRMLDVDPKTRISAKDASKMFVNVDDQQPIGLRKTTTHSKLPNIIHQKDAPLTHSPDTMFVPGVEEMQFGSESDGDEVTKTVHIPRLELPETLDQISGTSHESKKVLKIAHVNPGQGAGFRLEKRNTSPLSQSSVRTVDKKKSDGEQHSKEPAQRRNKASGEVHSPTAFSLTGLESSNLHDSLESHSVPLPSRPSKVSRGSSPALSTAAWSERAAPHDTSSELVSSRSRPSSSLNVERPLSLNWGDSLQVGTSRVLTYQVKRNVRHVIFSRSSQIVAFVADDLVAVFVLTNNRSGRNITTMEGSSYLNASVSDKDILIRTQENDGDITRRVLKLSSMARDQAGYLSIKFVTECDPKYFDGVLSDNDHVLLQAHNAVHLLAITTTGIRNNITLKVQGSTKKCWFSSDMVWAVVWSSQGRDHYIKRWKIQDPTESFQTYHFTNSNDTPIRDIISLDSLDLHSPARYIVWQTNNDLAILQEDISKLTQRQSWNLPGLNAVISGPNGSSIIYIQGHRQALVPARSELSHASILYKDSEQRFAMQRIGLPIMLQIGLQYNRQYPLVMEPNPTERIIIFIGHCDGRVEEVALPRNQDVTPATSVYERSENCSLLSP